MGYPRGAHAAQSRNERGSDTHTHRHACIANPTPTIYACIGNADVGDVAARIYKVAKIVADTKEENMSLYKKGTKKLPQSEWCQPLTEPEPNVRWSNYAFHPYQKKQMNRTVDGRGATQTREELSNGALEETMYKQVMTNDGVKDFQDKIAKGLLSRTGDIPEAIRDAKGIPRTGLPRPPHALERPERAMMSIQKAAAQVGVPLAAMPISKPPVPPKTSRKPFDETAGPDHPPHLRCPNKDAPTIPPPLKCQNCTVMLR